MRVVVPIALLAALTAPAAHAADVQTTLRVERGHLSMTMPRAQLRIPAATRAVAAQHGFSAVTVSDRRGSGAGWSLQLAATLHRPDGRLVRNAAITVPGIRARCLQTCTLPATRVRYPVLLGARPVRVFAARRNTGMGTMRLIAALRVSRPPKAPNRRYVLVQTWTRTAGP